MANARIMTGVSRMMMLLLALNLSVCRAFTVSPAARFRWTTTITNSMQRTAPTTLEHHRPTFYCVGAACRAQHSTKAAQPSSDKQRAAMVTTSIATFAGSAGAAHADNVAEGFAQGVGALNGPGLLAIPIVLGSLVASAIALFIYSSSQPREFDE